MTTQKFWCIETEYEKDKDIHLTTRRIYFCESDIFTIEAKERAGFVHILIILTDGVRHNCTIEQLSEVKTDSIIKMLKDKKLN